jgi:copper chaperone CopZ
MERLTLDISGMSCGHCVAAVDKALRSLDGVAVESVKIGSATVEYDPARVSSDALIGAIDDAGYAATEAA